MKMMIALIVAILVLAGCSGSDEPPTSSEIRDQLGCVSFWHDTSQEMFVKDKYDCVFGDHETTVYTFQDDDDRDSWIEIADELAGVHVLNQGLAWVEVKP